MTAIPLGDRPATPPTPGSLSMPGLQETTPRSEQPAPRFMFDHTPSSWSLLSYEQRVEYFNNTVNHMGIRTADVTTPYTQAEREGEEPEDLSRRV